MGQKGSLMDKGILMGQRDPIYGTIGILMGQRDPIYGTKGSYLWDKRISFVGQRDPYGTKGSYLLDKGILIYGPRALWALEPSMNV